MSSNAEGRPPSEHFELTIVGRRFQPVLLRLIRKSVAGNPVHPCLEAVARLIGVPIPDHPQKYFMNQVFRRRLSPGKPEEETKQIAVPVLIDFAHARQISARDGHHQFMICLIHLRVPIR